MIVANNFADKELKQSHTKSLVRTFH